jgi:hypothetical protein
MIHSILHTDRAAPWPLTGRWLDGLGQAATAVWRLVVRRCGFGNDMPELQMSPEWLEECEQRSRKHPDGM